MATVTITFSTDSDAFYGDPASEVRRILGRIADKVADLESDDGKVIDLNGATVGHWQVTE